MEKYFCKNFYRLHILRIFSTYSNDLLLQFKKNHPQSKLLGLIAILKFIVLFKMMILFYIILANSNTPLFRPQ